ncbi:helix-turn-helix domain-containing protein [Clostridium sp.]|uniref:helix-turn-helix domain-containing protein n=1 Tax=Clostridium sp. TaxID=1506 RepID=UPI000821C0AD|nr:helix-turn-helix domain-containing protein [Clostridium sp.]SCK02105.1 Helix-turn-helix [uncultured Clostridium sp.]
MHNLSTNIKLLRKINNISQRELGRRIGKSGQYISHLESTPTASPSLDVIFSIAKVFNVSVDELTGLTYDINSYEERPHNYSEITHREHLDIITENLNLESAFHLILKELNCDFSLMDKLDYEFFETSLLRYAKFLYTEILNNKK